ncbi:MAG: hypothetical protein [Caudoviricetes sp.]|nr:MAG: hypothetical protein [Caudoviricetes sp.]
MSLSINLTPIYRKRFSHSPRSRSKTSSNNLKADLLPLGLLKSKSKLKQNGLNPNLLCFFSNPFSISLRIFSNFSTFLSSERSFASMRPK